MEVCAFFGNIHVPWILPAFRGKIHVPWIFFAFCGYICIMWILVETTGFHGAGHAVETMDEIIQAPSLPVKIYLDEIDTLGNYEYISP